MSEAYTFDHTLDKPLPEDAPTRMLAPRQSAYTDPERLQAEINYIFEKDWVMVGRVGQVPNPGDYITALVGRKPIFVIRQKDGTLRAMANFCLHRYAKLLKGSGNRKRISCPYHSWTYEIGGALIGVTDKTGFDKADITGRALETLACETYLGFIFVSLKHDLPPLSKRLGELSKAIENFDLDDYEDRHVVEEDVWVGNWKLLIENFIESYHTTYTHVDSIGPTNPTKLAEFGPRDFEGFSIHSNSYRPEDFPEIHNEKLTNAERRKFYVISAYPNGLIALDPNFVWWMALEPLSTDTSNAKWGLSFSKHAMEKMEDPDAYVAEIIRVIEVAISEDKEMVERVQEGCAFATDEPGLLHSPLEIPLKEFTNYVEKAISRK